MILPKNKTFSSYTLQFRTLLLLVIITTQTDQDCFAKSSIVVRILESGWFGTAQKIDKKYDIAIDPSGKLSFAIHDLTNSILDDRLEGFSFGPTDYEHNISYDVSGERKFSLLLRKSDAGFQLEKQLAEFIKMVAFLGNYNTYDKIRSDLEINVITEKEAVSALLNNDFLIFATARKFYFSHWIPWCDENDVIPDIKLWGDLEETFSEFLLSDVAKRRADLWTLKIRSSWIAHK